MGEETELDRVAREEEKKLLERRKAKGKGSKTAASKRLAKIGEGQGQASLGRHRRRHRPRPTRCSSARPATSGSGSTIRPSGRCGVAVLGVGGALGWTYWQDKRQADASALLAQGFADEHGHVTTKDDDDDDEGKPEHALSDVQDRRPSATMRSREVPRGRGEVPRHRARRSSPSWPRRGSCSTGATPRAPRLHTRR